MNRERQELRELLGQLLFALIYVLVLAVGGVILYNAGT